MTVRVAPLELVRRPRRLRRSAALRQLVSETVIEPHRLVPPLFVVSGVGETQPVASLPGVDRLSVDRLLPRLEHLLKLGIRAALLFGVVAPDTKSACAATAFDPEGPVPRALRAARSHFGDDLVLITDVCLCAYTDHGHCGLLAETPWGVQVDNDSSLEPLTRMALAHARAGADLVAPSDMMDGRVAAIRRALDSGGFEGVGILSYAVKYASAFYGPFRAASASAPKGTSLLQDRTSYQLDPRNAREGLLEAALDEAEGADVLMVKPALPYLDILARLRARTGLSLVAYQVSGEYAMLKAAAAVGALDEPAAVREALLSIRRAGADLIFSYYAAEVIEKGWLR